MIDALYTEIPWYELESGECKILLIIMSQQVNLLKAGGVYPLTFEGYKDVVSNIYSQCTTLKALVDTFN